MSISTAARLLFRADGNATIGLGHLVRLLALADQLRGLAPGIFLVREPTAAVAQLVAAAGWEIQPLPDHQPWLAEASWLAQSFVKPTDIVVLDGYDFGTDYQQLIHTSGCGLVYIDDLLAWPVVADLLINHSPGIVAASYQATASTRFLLGPAFSLLRPPFLARAAVPHAPTPITSALVCFGGADPLRLSVRTLAALRALSTVQRLGVLLGGAFGDTAALEQLATSAPGAPIAIYRNINATALVDLLQTYAVAVVPASTVLIEALVLGRPALTGYYADNQRALAAYVHSQEQAFSIGNFADLTDAELLAGLRQGIEWLGASQRQPYTEQLQPARLRAEIQRLLQRHQP